MESTIATPTPSSSTVIEVFRTNVNDVDQAQSIRAELLKAIPSSKINFDLQDCDKILRVESSSIDLALVTDIVTSCGYFCEVLI